MSFDFDAPIDRAGGPFRDSTKWNKYAGRDVLPLWVADMDFAAPPPVIDALHRRVAHGVFGYGQPWTSLHEAVLAHLDGEYGWRADPAWIVWLPGLVTGLAVACRATGRAGDAVFTATPVYPPFLHVPGEAGRRCATTPLVRGEERWEWDFAATEAELRDSRPPLWLFCHPHNPVGRAWSDGELERVAALAEQHDLVVCSDEIHCDLLLEPAARHRPLASLGPEIARRTITLMAPSKTFNVPGLGCAFAVIPDPRLRRDFRTAMHGIVPHVNILGLVACEVALREGGAWRRELLAYLRGNAAAVSAWVARQPSLATTAVEATYLAWIDARRMAVEQPARHFESHGVGLSDGADFAAPGYVRLNFGCRRELLDAALARMETALLSS